ncbi:MAG: efflux RND transporter periplasmic adaptor subunit [Pseudohongiellaceae bacterium]
MHTGILSSSNPLTRFVACCQPARATIGLAALALVLAGCGNDSATQERGGGPGGPGGGGMNRPAVEVLQARTGALPLEERLTGQIIARNQTAIYPEVSGPIVEVLVDDGAHVEAGDPLVQIRDTEYRERVSQARSALEVARAQTRQAEANLEQLRTQMRRVEDLAERRLETQAALDDISAQVSVAEANLSLREAQEQQAGSQLEEQQIALRSTTVRAPVTGQVGQRNAERGQQASTGDQLFMVGDLSQVRAEVSLTERMLSYVREGMSVNVSSDYWTSAPMEAELSRISPFLNTQTLRTRAYVDIDNSSGRLRPGMFVTVDVLYGESEEATLIPNSALYRNPDTGEQGVFVVEAGASLVGQVENPREAPPLSDPLPVSFVPVQIVASGRMATGVTGIDSDTWVVAVGQNLLVGNVEEARARVMDWDRLMEMQRMESRDLFQIIDREREARTDS